jgi:hypothetical protein
MAFTEVSPTHENTIRAIDKPINEEDGIYPAGAHHPDHPDMVRVLKPSHPSRISRGIATPVAEKTEDFRFKDIGCHTTRSPHYKWSLRSFHSLSLVVIKSLRH